MKHVHYVTLPLLYAMTTSSLVFAQEAPIRTAATPLSGGPAMLTTRSSRTEANSLALFITGLGLTLVGLGGLGGGYAAHVSGRQQCDADALRATRDAPIIAGAAGYEVVYSRCLNESGAVIGGAASMITGATLTAVGTAFIIAGAWRVTVPLSSTSKVVPALSIGTSSFALRWTL
jgi:hypothetical protein